MTYLEAQELKIKHSNLQGHLILQGSVMIIKLFIAPTIKEEFDLFMMNYSKHSHKTSTEVENILKSKVVNVYVLYYEKGGDTKTKSIKDFIDQVIPPEELRSNIS